VSGSRDAGDGSSASGTDSADEDPGARYVYCLVDVERHEDPTPPDVVGVEGADLSLVTAGGVGAVVHACSGSSSS